MEKVNSQDVDKLVNKLLNHYIKEKNENRLQTPIDLNSIDRDKLCRQVNSHADDYDANRGSFLGFFSTITRRYIILEYHKKMNKSYN